MRKGPPSGNSQIPDRESATSAHVVLRWSVPFLVSRNISAAIISLRSMLS